jgi:hypothetical protein
MTKPSFLLAAGAMLFASAPDLRAESHQPFYLMGGIDYLTADARALTTKRGIHAGFGYISNEAGMIGCSGVDIDWRHAENSNGNRIDSVSTCYSERAYIDQAYFGFGIGSVYNRVEFQSPGGRVRDHAWRPMGKAMIGYAVGWDVIVEGGYFLTGNLSGVNTNGITLSAGVWF